ncbi:unnamed protein product, partial [marine sediment metagenome]
LQEKQELVRQFRLTIDEQNEIIEQLGQKSVNRRNIYIGIIIGLIVIIVILIIWFTRKR